MSTWLRKIGYVYAFEVMAGQDRLKVVVGHSWCWLGEVHIEWIFASRGKLIPVIYSRRTDGECACVKRLFDAGLLAWSRNIENQYPWADRSSYDYDRSVVMADPRSILFPSIGNGLVINPDK